MPDAYSTLTTLTKLLNSETIAPLMMQQIRDASFMPDLVHRKDMTNQNTNVYQIPIAPAVVAFEAMTEATTSLTVRSYTPTAATCSPGQYGALLGFTLQDRQTLSDPDAVIAGIVAEHMSKLAEGIDDALVALFTGLTGTAIGSTGTALTAAKLLTGLINARVAKMAVPGAQLVYVLHPKAYGEVASDILSSGAIPFATGIGNSVLGGASANSSAPVAVWLGTPIYTTTLIDKINADVDWCGALFPMARSSADVNCPLVLTTKGAVLAKTQEELKTATDLVGLYYTYGVARSAAGRGSQVVSVVA